MRLTTYLAMAKYIHIYMLRKRGISNDTKVMQSRKHGNQSWGSDRVASEYDIISKLFAISQVPQPIQGGTTARCLEPSFGALLYPTLHTPTLPYIPLHCPTYLYTALHTSTLPYIALHCPTYLYTALHTPVLPYIPLLYPTYPYSTLHTPTLPYIPLLYTTYPYPYSVCKHINDCSK